MANFLSEALAGAKAQFAQHSGILPLLEAWEKQLSECNSGSSPDKLQRLNQTGAACINAIEGEFPLGGYDLTPLRQLLAAQPSE